MKTHGHHDRIYYLQFIRAFLTLCKEWDVFLEGDDAHSLCVFDGFYQLNADEPTVEIFIPYSESTSRGYAGECHEFDSSSHFWAKPHVRGTSLMWPGQPPDDTNP